MILVFLFSFSFSYYNLFFSSSSSSSFKSQKVMPAVVEAAKPVVAEPEPVVEETHSKKKKPPPKREIRPMRSSSTNDVTEEVEDPMQAALTKRFGAYCDSIQAFLMTQGVLQEDDLMIRDILKMMTTAQQVGVKPVQLSKLKEWMTELKDLADGPIVRPILPHERRGSKLRVSKSAISQTGKEYDNAVRASRASRDMEGSFDAGSRRTSRSSNDDVSVASRRSSKSNHSSDSKRVSKHPHPKSPKKSDKPPAAAEDLSL